MRVFLAVPCGEQLTAAVTTALDGWRAGPGADLPVRWTRAQTWHLTLQFLGDWPADRLAVLKTALAQVSGQAPFTLTTAGLGGYPNLKSPRVLFLHMAAEGQAARLAGQVRAVVNETWSDGPQDNRPFRGHLTLARIKAELSRPDVNLLQDLKLGELPGVPVDGFSLMASELEPTGPRYTELAFYALRK
jgi:2'-5' RNA ligase